MGGETATRGPGTRVSAVTCRAPPPSGLTQPRRAAPGGSPAGSPGPSYPLWRRRLGPQGRAGCKKYRCLRLGILLVLSRHPPPPLQPPLSLCRDETRKARRVEWERDASLAPSGLRKVLPPRPCEGRRGGGGGSRSRPRRPRTFSFAAFEQVHRAF